MPERPPKAWFEEMKKRIRKQYPFYKEKRINRIVGGIWYDYDIATRKRIIERTEKNPQTRLTKYAKTDGRLYSALRKSWTGYNIAISENDTDKARKYAKIINLIRSKHLKEKPINFYKIKR